MNTKHLLSVCMSTYNHEFFISQAIEGVLMQKTNFDFILIIGEDCSTDNTRNIISDFVLKNPDKIRLIISENNVGSIPNLIRIINSCESKYIALCEGDDYWTDPFKLQKQVDFLEQNPNYSFCFHNAIKIFDDTITKPQLFNDLDERQIHDYKSLIERDWFVATASMVFVKKYISFSDWFVKIINDDFAMQLILANKGPFYYMPDVMSVYRLHSGGVSNAFSNKIFLLDSLIYILNNVKPMYSKECHEVFENQILKYTLQRDQLQKALDYPYLKYLKFKTYKKYIGKFLNIQMRPKL